ncbi:hypothetical protein N8935_07675 [Amylibacter sp.]|nr:hypothetical protein [Amylibacter sp.]
MQLLKVLSIVIILLMSATGLKADSPTIEELSYGITAFLCEDDIAVKTKIPLIFTQSEDKWVLNSDSSVSVTKVRKGFMLIFPPPNQGIGILSAHQNGSWKYEYLREKESWETTCSKQDDFTRTLIEIISPRIIESTSSFSFPEYKEMITDNNIIKSLRIDLDKSFSEIERLASELSQAKTELYKKSRVADIIINKMKLCWNPPVGFENGTTNSITLGLKFDIDGKLLESPTNLTPVSEVGSLIAFEAARRAVIRCSPYNELDPKFYFAWKEIKLIF